MEAIKINLHDVINMRGMREQVNLTYASKRIKQCYTRGCEVFVPLHHAIRGRELSAAITYQSFFYGEYDLKSFFNYGNSFEFTN